MSQDNQHNPAANSAPDTTTASAKPRYRVAWVLGAFAICLYLGSIVWFYLTRGAGA